MDTLILYFTESVAIDLSWDIICRFTDCALPKEFYSDWIKVAQDEAKVNWLEGIECLSLTQEVHNSITGC